MTTKKTAASVDYSVDIKGVYYDITVLSEALSGCFFTAIDLYLPDASDVAGKGRAPGGKRRSDNEQKGVVDDHDGAMMLLTLKQRGRGKRGQERCWCKPRSMCCGQEHKQTKTGRHREHILHSKHWLVSGSPRQCQPYLAGITQNRLAGREYREYVEIGQQRA